MLPYESSGSLPKRVCGRIDGTLPLRRSRTCFTGNPRRRSAENIGVRKDNRRARFLFGNEDPTKKGSQPGLATQRRKHTGSGALCADLTAAMSQGRTNDRLGHQLTGRFDHLSAAVMSAVLTSPVHDLRVAAVVALHELGRLQLVVIRRTTLAGARFRMSSFRNSHGSVVQENETGRARRLQRIRCQAVRENGSPKMGGSMAVFRGATSFRLEFTAERQSPSGNRAATPHLSASPGHSSGDRWSPHRPPHREGQTRE